MKWEFTLPNSEAIRDLIDSGEHNDELLREIMQAYKYIWNHFREDYEENFYFFSDITDDIEMEEFDDDSVNWHVNELFEYCDSRGVWVSL